MQTLRAMPVVDPRTPTLCLVGAPNVGKSSLVRILSSGKPEVIIFFQASLRKISDSVLNSVGVVLDYPMFNHAGTQISISIFGR